MELQKGQSVALNCDFELAHSTIPQGTRGKIVKDFNEELQTYVVDFDDGKSEVHVPPGCLDPV